MREGAEQCMERHSHTHPQHHCGMPPSFLEAGSQPLSQDTWLDDLTGTLLSFRLSFSAGFTSLSSTEQSLLQPAGQSGGQLALVPEEAHSYLQDLTET